MESDGFQVRVQAAAVAAWWVVLAALATITVQWLAYLVIVPAQPAWYLSMWGPGVTWAEVQEIWLNVIVNLKLGMFAGASLALWLTLWSRLRRTRSNA